MENINWYPGHMKKASDLIKENLKAVDAAALVLDARIPMSSGNTAADFGGKKQVIILNRIDLAKPSETSLWKKYFEGLGYKVALTDGRSGEGVPALLKLFEKARAEKNKERGRNLPYRLMIAGVPNVGKSSLINKLMGSGVAKTGKKPGLTRGKQWLKLQNGIMLLDTPGILRPKLKGEEAGRNLAFCGSIRDEILDITELSSQLCEVLSKLFPELLRGRYKSEEGSDISLTLEKIAESRGFLLSGGKPDIERAARCLLDEFRSGVLGRVTLEKAPRNSSAIV